MAYVSWVTENSVLSELSLELELSMNTLLWKQ
jgi:hypothetical protein